jgi:hypothetical protein
MDSTTRVERKGSLVPGPNGFQRAALAVPMAEEDITSLLYATPSQPAETAATEDHLRDVESSVAFASLDQQVRAGKLTQQR